jgi:hypothetical protein
MAAIAMVKDGINNVQVLAKADLVFVANTIIMINGIGLTRNLAVRCNTVAAIKSIDVTSSTRAANNPDISINKTTSLVGSFPIRAKIISNRCSKKCLSSKYPITIIIVTKNNIMSRLANSTKVPVLRRLSIISAAIPINANARRNFQNRRVPKINEEKTVKDAT